MPHRRGGRGEKMAAAVPVPFGLGADQSQIGFVHQGGGLQGLARLFFRQLVSSEAAQFLVN